MSNKKNKYNLKQILILTIVLILLGITGCVNNNTEYNNDIADSTIVWVDIENIPEYSGKPYVKINNNIPSFSESDYTTTAFEMYSELDEQKRCGVAYANICKEIMPLEDEERGAINSVIPSGWQQTTYEGMIENDYLYNRCHLIGHQLSGENANDKNLITGTRYMNVEGMLPFENDIAEYIEKNEDNHVLYRVTPIFEGDNLVASGVHKANVKNKVLSIYIPEKLPTLKNISSYAHKQIILNVAAVTKPYEKLFYNKFVIVIIKIFDTRKVWDVDNRTVKPIQDGLIYGGVIEDDNLFNCCYMVQGFYSDTPHIEVSVLEADNILKTINKNLPDISK